MVRAPGVVILLCSLIATCLGQVLWFGGGGVGGSRDAEMLPPSFPRQGGGPGGSYRPKRDYGSSPPPPAPRRAPRPSPAAAEGSQTGRGRAAGDSRPAFFGDAEGGGRPAAGRGGDAAVTVGAQGRNTVVIRQNRGSVPVHTAAKRIPVVQGSGGRVPVSGRRRVPAFVIRNGRRIPVIVRRTEGKIPVIIQSGAPEPDGGVDDSHNRREGDGEDRAARRPGTTGSGAVDRGPVTGQSGSGSSGRRVSTKPPVAKRKVGEPTVARRRAADRDAATKPAKHAAGARTPTVVVRRVQRRRPVVVRRRFIQIPFYVGRRRRSRRTPASGAGGKGSSPSSSTPGAGRAAPTPAGRRVYPVVVRAVPGGVVRRQGYFPSVSASRGRSSSSRGSPGSGVDDGLVEKKEAVVSTGGGRSTAGGPAGNRGSGGLSGPRGVYRGSYPQYLAGVGGTEKGDRSPGASGTSGSGDSGKRASVRHLVTLTKQLAARQHSAPRRPSQRRATEVMRQTGAPRRTGARSARPAKWRRVLRLE
ncbi:translation initiation factor IF-2-like [Amphibalanus amphitrite]|uniref:translation initiation factor IF-2-like n=1 Tax=Amphibalanus amphitrite TaxID=1232801 RepID=UPI001C928F4B|nr:translation initiation factor IF-2-like [Amphibalanus amphitrite]